MPESTRSGSPFKVTLFIAVMLVGGSIALLFGLPTGRKGRGGTGAPEVRRTWSPALFTLRLSPSNSGWKVEGEARIDDRARVPLEIVCFDPEGKAFDSKTAVVSGGRISTEFGPYPSPFPSGQYTLRIHQRGGIPFPTASHRIGDGVSEAREEEERKRHFVRVLAEAREAISDLDEASKAALGGTRFADSKGRFLADSWRRWIGEVFLGGLDRVDGWQQAFEAAYAVDRHAEASDGVAEVLRRLKALASHASEEIYRHYGLPPPPEIVAPQGTEGLAELIDQVADRAGVLGRSPAAEDRSQTIRSDGAALTRKRRGRAFVLAVEGSVSLPDGCEYTVDLRYDRLENTIIASGLMTGPDYWLLLSSPDRTIPSGKYILQIRLDFRRQPQEVQRRIEEEMPDLRQGLARTIEFEVGTEEEVRREEEARIDYYQEVLKGASRWFWEMRDRLEDTSRGEAFTGEGGELDVELLRAWSTETDEELAALQEGHESFRGSTLAPKYESVDRSIDQLLRALANEKAKGLGALMGRSVTGGTFDIRALVGVGEMNSLVRTDICPPIGLPPVTLGSLRLGEAREALRAGERERALAISFRLGRSRSLDRVVAAHGLDLAIGIYMEEGKEWRALPLLERLGKGKRFRGLAAARKAQKDLEGVLAGVGPWTREKQEAYRDDIAATLDGIRSGIDEGRIEAADHRLKGWAVLQKGFDEAFRARVDDPEILAEMDRLFASAKEEAARLGGCQSFLREALGRLERLSRIVKGGNLPRYRDLVQSDLVPFIDRAKEEETIPGAVVGRATRRMEGLRELARSIDELQKAVLEKIGALRGVAADGSAAVFRLPGREKDDRRRPGEQIVQDIYLIEIREGADGWVVIVQMTGRDFVPLSLPKP